MGNDNMQPAEIPSGEPLLDSAMAGAGGLGCLLPGTGYTNVAGVVPHKRFARTVRSWLWAVPQGTICRYGKPQTCTPESLAGMGKA